MQAILLAAGFGTRLRPYTDLKPKPLFPVCNQPLLETGLKMLKEAGCEKIVVNCHHLAGQIIDALADHPGIIIQYEQEILGTGGSLRKALNHLEADPVLVMNGDIYHDIDLAALYRFHADHKDRVTMAVHDYPRFNALTVEKGRVLSFSGAATNTKAFTGVHVVDPEVIAMIPETGFFHIIDLYRELAHHKEIAAYSVDGCFWRDMGTPEDYLKLHEKLLTRETGTPFWKIDQSATVGQAVRFNGWGAVGKNVIIGAGSTLANTVVWDNAVVAPGRVIKDTIVTGNAADD